MDSIDFQAIRKEYENAGIQEEELPQDPFQLFQTWYDLAVEKCPGRWFEANAMCLATTDLNGNVTNRIVLLKGVVDEGFRFFTNYDSKKGSQLEINPKCAVTFHWPYLGRQIRIEGTVSKTSREVSAEYFHSRPHGSQLSAAASRQSQPVESRNDLEQQQQAVAESLANDKVPLPDFWGGYLINPLVIEFWQGRLDRLHDRIVFKKPAERWERIRISP